MVLVLQLGGLDLVQLLVQRRHDDEIQETRSRFPSLLLPAMLESKLSPAFVGGEAGVSSLFLCSFYGFRDNFLA